MELVADGQELKYVQGKNKDLREVTLRAKSAGDGQEGPVLLKFAQAYGFRNIQNIMRRIKQGKCDYDYVELMACPSGCTNGGGQIKVSQLDKDRVGNVVENQELVKSTKSLYRFACAEPTCPKTQDRYTANDKDGTGLCNSCFKKSKIKMDQYSHRKYQCTTCE